MVSQYTGLDFFQIQDLDYLDYLLLRRDAFIHSMLQNEKGQEYLDNAWMLEQTSPDRASLREQFSGG